MSARPFRAPHHSVSVGGLIGGGSPPHPGEVTLAHRGVLFMDELPEFQQHVLESLRQPIEDGTVAIARTAGVSQFPARFQLVAAANPCRRGCPSLEQCVCTPGERDRYLGRVSGPLLDRIDLHVELPALGAEEFANDARADDPPPSARVALARDASAVACLPALRGQRRADATQLRGSARRRRGPRLLAAAIDAARPLGTRPRPGLKVARTIADIAGRDRGAEHCAEALPLSRARRRWRA